MFNETNASAFSDSSHEPYDPTDSSNPFITPAAAFSQLTNNPLGAESTDEQIQFQFDSLTIHNYLGFMAKVFSEALYQEMLTFQKDPNKPLRLLDQANLFAGNLMCHKGSIYQWAAEKFDYDIHEWKCFCEEDHLSTHGAEGGMGHE